jgi:LmbE family N-acetylglucosaminyl deacetylase
MNWHQRMPHHGKSGIIIVIKETAKQSMHNFQFFADNAKPKILCLGAHADDIEIGCGGTILKLAREYPKAEFHWVVFSAEGKRAEEARRSAEAFLGNIASKKLDVQTFKDSYFPFVGATIKDYFVNLKEEISPDLVITHYSNDSHQDHQLIAKLTWNAFRDNFILEYEIPKYDGDLGIPNFYVQLNKSFVQAKISTISGIFESQIYKQWFGEETLRSIMRIRGIECNSPSKYAEAFYCRKIVM